MKKIGTLVILGALTLSGCGTGTIKEESPDTKSQATAPPLRQYEPVADESKALSNLSKEQFDSYYDIICHTSSFRDFSEIEKSLTESPEEKEMNYAYINDAPDVVRQISDRNKNQVSSDTALEKPQPPRCQEQSEPQN